MGLLEDTFKFSTGGNYYGTGDSYYDDQEKKKNEWKTRFNARHGIGITKDQNWIDAKKGSRNDLMKFMAQKEKENYIIKKKALDKTRPDYSVSGTQNQNLMKNDFTKGRTSDGMDLGKWHGNNAQDQQSWWQKLAGKAGIDYKTAAATWKKKGGFEGLMANPAFTMGLAFMQAGAEGKTLGQGALDNVMKSAGISSHYKKILEDRKLEPIQATGGDIAQVKDMLKSINIEEGNWVENLLGGKESGAKYEAAVEEIALEFQKEIRAKQKVLLEKGESQVIRQTDQLKILERLVNSKKIKKKGSIFARMGITAYTLEDTSGTKGFDNKARGGPVAKGQPYVVGEGGPEYFLPKQSGKILSNDDSRIFAMLLTANPQLQQVSRTRAEKILRNRFPEYFE
jgi:hypothetical protein